MASSVLPEMLPAASNNRCGDIPARVNRVFTGRAGGRRVVRRLEGDSPVAFKDFGLSVDLAMTFVPQSS